MKPLSLPLCLRLATALVLVSSTAASAVEFSERGVHRFESRSGCPQDMPGEEPDTPCNRVTLNDPGLRADVYVAQRAVSFRAKAPGAEKLSGDVLLHGRAQAENGRSVPVSLHLRVQRLAGKWRVEPHVHSPLEGRLTDVRIDPYTVSVFENGQTQTLFTPEDARQVLADPLAAARKSQSEYRFQNHLAGKPATAGMHKADVTVSAVKGATTQPLLRARFELKLDADTPNAPLRDLLLNSTWTLEIKALSDQVPREAVQQALFVYGLEKASVLHAVRDKGLPKNASIVLGASGGHAFVRYGKQKMTFDPASAAAQVFLQDDFIGLVLAAPQDR